MSPRSSPQDKVTVGDYSARVDRNKIVLGLSDVGARKKKLGLRGHAQAELLSKITEAINRIEEHLGLPPTDFSEGQQPHGHI